MTLGLSNWPGGAEPVWTGLGRKNRQALKREPSARSRILRLATDLAREELDQSDFTRNAAILLRETAGDGALGLTERGNFSRIAVAALRESMTWPDMEAAEELRAEKRFGNRMWGNSYSCVFWQSWASSLNGAGFGWKRRGWARACSRRGGTVRFRRCCSHSPSGRRTCRGSWARCPAGYRPGGRRITRGWCFGRCRRREANGRTSKVSRRCVPCRTTGCRKRTGIRRRCCSRCAFSGRCFGSDWWNSGNRTTCSRSCTGARAPCSIASCRSMSGSRTRVQPVARRRQTEPVGLAEQAACEGSGRYTDEHDKRKSDDG